MTREEKFSKLAELFNQRAAIDVAITNVIDGKEVGGETNIKAPKQRKKWTRQSNREKRFYCLDCKHVFSSTSTKLDAVCPECNSVHIAYAAAYNK